MVRPADRRHFDVIVVGAGFSGLYALHKFRELGLSVRVLEMADAVGGTWLWNRYPGARCDIESIEYSYSFSDAIQQEWEWTENLPAQPEIEAYLNFVADRLDLRRDIQLDTKVVDLSYDKSQSGWMLTTHTGERFSAAFVIAATGILSAPLDPAIPGKETFTGVSLYSSRFPKEGFDFSGKRVAIIGTGSTGVQAIPVVAEQAEQLFVFQRSAAYTLPSNARMLEPGELDELKSRYDEIRTAQRAAHVGAARLSAFSVLVQVFSHPPIKTATPAERAQAVAERGIQGALYWSDVFTDMEANEIARELYGVAIAGIVNDPETAAALVPNYPFGCKRPIIDQGYYQTYNRQNVTLIDLQKSPIESITPTGIATVGESYDLDVILFATGFDAVTGALTSIDVRGRDGVLLRDVWREEGPVAYLGLQIAGFPNLFMVQGPGSPSLASNFVTALEQHIDWIADCITHVRDSGQQSIEALPSAQAEWIEHAMSLVEGSVLLAPSCNSWWNGANVPGKKRMYTSYVGGIPEFRNRCDQVAAAGYAGFRIA